MSAKAETRAAREHQYREHMKADRLYAEWLQLRAHTLADRNATYTDEEADTGRKERVELDFIALPCALPWMVFRKLEMLRARLVDEAYAGGGNHTALRMLGAIEADLMAAGLSLMTEPYNER